MGNKHPMKDKTQHSVNFIVLLVQNTVQIWKKNNDSKKITRWHTFNSKHTHIHILREEIRS